MLLTFPKFSFLYRISSIVFHSSNLCLLRNLSLPFIVIFWSLRGTIGSPVLPFGHQSMYCAHRSAGSVSLFFILSFLLVLFLWKSMVDYLFRNMLRLRLSRSNFWQFFFFIFFLKRAESHSADLKVFRCYSLFYTSSFWFPEALPTCAMRGRWFFPLFLLGHLALEKDVASPLFLVFLFRHFLSNCLNLLLTVLTRLGGSEPFGGLWGSRLSFLP